LLNFRRKSTDGLSLDFVGFNILAHTNYLTYCIIKYVAQTSGHGAVAVNDIAFAAQALAVAILLAFQMWWYRHAQGPSQALKILFLAEVALAPIAVILCSQRMVTLVSIDGGFALVDVCGYLKVFFLFLKYASQAMENQVQQSTKGLSYVFVVTDWSGCVLALGQNVWNDIEFHDPSYVIGNLVKILLFSIALFFDTVYMVQWCWFRPKRQLKILAPAPAGFENNVEDHLRANEMNLGEQMDFKDLITADMAA
jgi:cystinosin